MRRARGRLSRRQHHLLCVECDEPHTPPKSLGQTLTGEQEEELQRSIWLLENKMAEEEAAKAAQARAGGSGSNNAANNAAGTWIDDMDVN